MEAIVSKQKPACFGHDYFDPSLNCELCVWSFLCYQKLHEKERFEEPEEEDRFCILCDGLKEDPISLYCDRCWGKVFDKIMEMKA